MQVYKAIKYIRLSYTDDKTVESDSVANQRRLIDDYIARHPEIEVVAEKIDDGYSGVLFDRPAFQEMMRMIEQGEANCVIVKDLSRLGREYIETGRYMRRVFPAYGVRFIAINDNVDTENDAADDLTVSVKNIMNEAYCRDISVKTRSALEVKRRSGDFVGAFTIYGYVKVGDKHKSLEVDEYAANVVRDIFRKRLEGFSASHIADELNRLGILSPLAYKRNHGMPHAKGGYTDRKDCKWSATTIIRILQDETYTGTLVQGKQTTPHFKLKEREDKDYYNVSRTNGVWSTSTVLRILEDQRYIGTYVIGKRKVKEIGSRHTQLKDESEWFKIPNHHPAIVSVDLFKKANASIKRFSLSNKKPRDYLLRGKVFCGCCDHAMSLRNGAWFYCRHSEVAETLPCHGVRIKMADLEQVVFETIRAQMCPALGIDSNKDKLDLQTVQQAEHEEKLRSIQDSKRHLYEQYALGEIDLETYRTRKAVYDTELVQAKNVHAVITAQTKQIKSDYEIKLKQQEIVQEVGNANMLTKALIDRLINKVYVFPGDRIEIEYATQDFLETKESEKEV